MSEGQLDRIGRLAGVARALERQGAYNGAKLLRAALERELTRWADAAAPADAATADALDALGEELAGDGYPPAFLERLAAVASVVRRGETVVLDVAPVVRTCRVCGELFVGDAVPRACPTCEAPALSFREHLPIWYLEPAEPGTILAELATGPRRFAAALEGRDDATLDRAPRPGEWSARQTLEHLVHAESLLATRVPRLLEEDDPDLVAWIVGSGAPSDEATVPGDAPARELFERYRSMREATVHRLRELDEAGWGRAGRHPEWGRVTVLSQAAYFARHEASHLAQLVAAAEGRVPGA